MARSLVGLGSNLGDRSAQLARALELLCSGSECTLVRRSRWYRTRPVGGPADQPAFLNGAAIVETSLGPHEMHARLLAVEAQLGRRRKVRWGPRIIDLDLLLYDEQVIESPALSVPHPRMVVRRFVLVPSAEIAADWVHPTLGWTLGQLLAHLDTAAPYLAITGPPTTGKTALAEALAAKSGANLLRDPLVEPLIAAIEGPATTGPPTEEELIGHRRQILGAVAAGQSKWFISDFWIGQSLAFARAFLPAKQAAAFGQWWEQAIADVARPKLLAALDAPADELWRRLVARGVADEQGLDVPQFEELRLAFAEQLARPWGPLVRLSGLTAEEMLGEVGAALEAIDAECIPESE